MTVVLDDSRLAFVSNSEENVNNSNVIESINVVHDIILQNWESDPTFSVSNIISY